MDLRKSRDLCTKKKKHWMNWCFFLWITKFRYVLHQISFNVLVKEFSLVISDKHDKSDVFQGLLLCMLS